MRYEKPMAMDLNSQAVSGQQPLSCFDGNDPGSQGGYNICEVGTGADNSFWPYCATGRGATGNPGDPYVLCNGGSGTYWCRVGGSADAIYPDACTVGPSDLP